jgi:antitoxin component of RelBE/YafQ-DinJ toxin-antitoxin module
MIQTAQVNLKLEPQVKMELQAIAKKSGLSISDIANNLLYDFIAKHSKLNK